jgi:hypothetical protein
MRNTRRCAREVLLRLIVVGMVASLVGCTALPRGTLDPLTPILGLLRGEGVPAQTPAQPPASSGVPNTQEVPGKGEARP